MRLGFLALDPFDVQRAAKEAARGMVQPLGCLQRSLRRCVRCLIHVLTLTWRRHSRRWPGIIMVKGDTHWAGCTMTRRSSSGLTAQFGQHLWLTSRWTQLPVSFSSGEAETCGPRKACSCALGINSLAWVWAVICWSVYGQLNGSRRGAAAWLLQDPSFGSWVFVDTGRNQNWQDRLLDQPSWKLKTLAILTKRSGAGRILNGIFVPCTCMWASVVRVRSLARLWWSKLLDDVCRLRQYGWHFWNGPRGNSGMSRQCWWSASGTAERSVVLC